MSRVDQLLDYLAWMNYGRLSPQAVQACKTFMLDSFGVGVSGSQVDQLAGLMAVAQQAGQGSDARVWASGARLAAPQAAFINAYQIHNQEFDCVHEAAVVHPMAVIQSVLMAGVERMWQTGRAVHGRQLIAAVNAAVDVATIIGQSASQPMKFFRPGLCGGLGAVAGLCLLHGASRQQTGDALGIMYSQMGGTMQAHREGSPTLPVQIAFNARNAFWAFDLAMHGLAGPADWLDGEFGFFALMEDAGNADVAFGKLGREWQLPLVSHKPFPTGRAAHGGLDGIASLCAQHRISPEQIAAIHIEAPPLILRLVNRPARADMTHNYAKLCMGYIAATWLLTGDVTVADYAAEKLKDPARLALAQKIHLHPNGMEDPNALAPQAVRVELTDSSCYQVVLPAVLGNPARPLSREQHLNKFLRNCASASLQEDKARALIAAVDALELCDNTAHLVDLLIH